MVGLILDFCLFCVLLFELLLVIVVLGLALVVFVAFWVADLCGLVLGFGWFLNLCGFARWLGLFACLTYLLCGWLLFDFQILLILIVMIWLFVIYYYWLATCECI